MTIIIIIIILIIVIIIIILIKSLKSNVPFWFPWKNQRTKGFLSDIFSGMGMENWEVGLKVLKNRPTQKIKINCFDFTA